MRVIKMYQTRHGKSPVQQFLATLEPKLTEKVIRQLLSLAATPVELWREPHVKHFSLEKYSDFYELREKNKILVRLIFTIRDGDILLLMPFVKHQPRDTMKALEQSIRILADIRDNPGYAVELSLLKEAQK